MRLRDRQRQIPGGAFFYQPETKFKTQDWSSFSSIVDQVIQHRLGNPAMVAKHKWSTDRANVENEVDSFLANVCAQMGNMNFVVGGEGSPPPKQKPPSDQEVSQLSAVAARTRNAWSGARSLSEWIFSDLPAVPQEQSNARAKVCSECPQNFKGPLTAWFVKPLAMIIDKMMSRRSERNLRTDYDEQLGTCQACDCAMAVKCHAPLEVFKGNTSDAVMDKLRQGKDCWILKELAA